MSSYENPPRPRRDGRPRYYEDDASDEESYYAPLRRNRRPPEDRRPPPEDRRLPPEDRRPPPDERRPLTEDNLPPPPFPSDHPRRPSILISPDETASQRASRLRSRSIDRVRLQASSSDDEYNDRRGPPRPKPTRQLSHDLERKTTDESKRFRSRRNDYESDEGETLRKSKRPSEEDPGKSRRRDYEDYGGGGGDGDARYPPERKEIELDRAKNKASLPLRGKPRAVGGRDGRDGRNEPPVEYGAAPVAAVAGTAMAAAAARPRVRGYDTDPDRPSRPKTWGEDDFKREQQRLNRDRDRYDDDDHYDRRPPRPRPRPTFVDDPENTYARSGGGPARRRDRYEDDGYDDYRRRERDDPYRAERDRDRDRNGALIPPRPRYDAYYSDSREDRAYPRPRDRDRNRDRVRDRVRDRDRDRDRDTRDDYYDRPSRDRYRDDYYDRDRRDRDERKGGNKDWQKQAGILFTTYALPMIKREGTKFMKKELANLIEKRGAGI